VSVDRGAIGEVYNVTGGDGLRINLQLRIVRYVSVDRSAMDGVYFFTDGRKLSPSRRTQCDHLGASPGAARGHRAGRAHAGPTELHGVLALSTSISHGKCFRAVPT
jgi:hypothetical protein